MDTRLASEIQVGDKVAEDDGCFFTVSAVKPSASGKTVVFTLKNTNGYMSTCKTMTVKCRASSKVRVLTEATK